MLEKTVVKKWLIVFYNHPQIIKCLIVELTHLSIELLFRSASLDYNSIDHVRSISIF